MPFKRIRPLLTTTRTVRRDVFDVPAEWVIAQGRLYLCALSLVAVVLDPPRPRGYEVITYFLLGAYLLFAIGVVIATNWRLPDQNSQRGIHAGDVITTALLLFLDERPTSPFVAFFTFILLAAALRWSWRGVLWTLLGLIVALIIASGSKAELETATELGPWVVTATIVRAAYLAVMAGMLAYVSTYRERSHMRLVKLAQWPAYMTASGGFPAFASTLAHAAQVLEVPAVIAIWKQFSDQSTRIATWRNGDYQQTVSLDNLVGDLIEPVAEFSLFATTDLYSSAVLLRTGHATTSQPSKFGDFLKQYGVSTFASATFQGTRSHGRIFILDRSDWNEDHLLLIEIITSRMAVELDRELLQAEAEQAAAMRERMRLARDLHDGVLQSLTAAALQLKLVSLNVNEEACSRLGEIKNLLISEQRRVREFVQATRPHQISSRNEELKSILKRRLEESAFVWNCTVTVDVEPKDLVVGEAMIGQVSLLLSEAIANAVRHGKASEVTIALIREGRELVVVARDNGTGIQERSGKELREPISLRERVAELDGSFDLCTSPAGTELVMRLPLGAEDRGSF